MTYYYVLLSACGFTTSSYPDIYVRFVTNDFTYFSNVQSSNIVIKDSQGRCYIIKSTSLFNLWTTSDPTYNIVVPSDYTAHADCVGCDPTYNPSATQIIKFTPCDVGSGEATYYVSHAGADPLIADIVAGKTTNTGNTNLGGNTCYTMSIDNTYALPLDTYDGSGYINGYLAPGPSSTINCTDCMTNIQGGSGSGSAIYRFTPCVIGSGTVFHTNDSVSAFEITPGVYKTVNIAGNCYSIAQVSSIDPSSQVPISIPTINSTHDTCGECLGEFFEFEDCTNATNKIYSKYSIPWADFITNTPTKVVKLQGQVGCWLVSKVTTGGTPTVVLIENSNYVDCTVCGAATPIMYQLTNCDTAAIEYTTLDLSYVTVGDLIKKLSDNSCWAVTVVANSGQSENGVLVTGYYNETVGVSLTINAISWIPASCNTCKDYKGFYKLTECTSGSIKYVNDYTFGLAYIGKTLKLQGIVGCWELEECGTCTGGETFETLTVLESLADCATCNTVLCYEVLSDCDNTTVILASNSEFNNQIGNSYVFDLNGDGTYNTRGSIAKKIASSSGGCDTAKSLSYISVGSAIQQVHAFQHCILGNIITSTSTALDSLVVGAVVALLYDVGGDIYPRHFGFSSDDTRDFNCWTYLGKQNSSGCALNGTTLKNTYGDCLTCANLQHPLDEVEEVGEGVCENPCYPAPVALSCNNFSQLKPCTEGENWEYDIVKLGLEGTEDEYVVKDGFWKFYDFDGYLARSKVVINLIWNKDTDAANLKFKAVYNGNTLCDVTFVNDKSDVTQLFHKEIVDAINTSTVLYQFKAYTTDIQENKDSLGIIKSYTLSLHIEYNTSANLNGKNVELTTRSAPLNLMVIDGVIIPDADTTTNKSLEGAVDATQLLQTSFEFNVPSDGIYKYILRNPSTGDVFEYILFAFCDLTNCYDTVLKLIWCNCDCADCGYEDKHGLLNAISTVYNSYINQIAGYYSLDINNGGLSTTQDELLIKIKDNYTKLIDLLGDCNNGCLEQKVKDCGCK